MTQRFPTAPSVGAPMTPTHASQSARDFLALRRSANKRALAEPGPNPHELDQILKIAMRVPDHRRLGPWRFIIFEGDNRECFSTHAAEIQRSEDPSATVQMLHDTATCFLRAPVIVAVIASPDKTHKTPVWEQTLSVGAVCMNLLLAANASGWAGCWLSEWIAYSPGIKALLSLSTDEQIASFIYLGTATEPPQERMRPDTLSRVSRWGPKNDA